MFCCEKALVADPIDYSDSAAGTDGTVEIYTEYAVSSGDGAIAAADIPVEATLSKQVAIAVALDGTKTLPSGGLFDGIIVYENTVRDSILDTTVSHASLYGGVLTNVSGSVVSSQGGIYANSPVIITAESTDFVHESDSTSIIKAHRVFSIGTKVASTYNQSKQYCYFGDGNNSNTTIFPATCNITTTAINAETNRLSFRFSQRAYLDTITATDRAGTYKSIITISIITQ